MFTSLVNSQVYTSSSHCYCGSHRCSHHQWIHRCIQVAVTVTIIFCLTCCNMYNSYFSFAQCAELYATGSRFINIWLWLLLLLHFTAYKVVQEALQTLWETLWEWARCCSRCCHPPVQPWHQALQCGQHVRYVGQHRDGQSLALQLPTQHVGSILVILPLSQLYFRHQVAGLAAHLQRHELQVLRVQGVALKQSVIRKALLMRWISPDLYFTCVWSWKCFTA